MDTNPYAAPSAPDESPPSGERRRVARAIGTAILAAGLVVLTYGAVAFWVIRSLPPNGGPSGRLPSLYVMGVGILAVIIGLAVRGSRSARQAEEPDGPKTIPTSMGILVLLAMVIAAIVAISRM